MKPKATYTTKTCACGCGKSFQTKRPKERIYYSSACRNRVFNLQHPRQKIGLLTEITINTTRYRLVPVETKG